MKHPGQFNNILIIKPGAIGDLLQMTPVIRALKTRYPQADITLLIGSAASAELFSNNALVRETIVFDKTSTHRSFRSVVQLWQSLRKNRYDLVINFQRSNLKTWFLASASLPCRVLVYHKTRSRNIHAVVNYLETLAPLGIETADLNLELDPGDKARAFAEKAVGSFGSKEQPLIALNPGASHPVNRWGTDRFAELSDLLAERMSARIVIIGGQSEVATAEEIAAKTAAKPLVLAGRTNLLELGALLKHCAVLVSGDTGPMHIAASVGTRVVALFGAADPARTGPVGVGHRVIQAEGLACVPCRSRRCANKIYRECMDSISPLRVFEAIREMIEMKFEVRSVKGEINKLDCK